MRRVLHSSHRSAVDAAARCKASRTTRRRTGASRHAIPTDSRHLHVHSREAAAGPLITSAADLASSDLHFSARATYVLATFYADANYAGASLLITTQYPDLCGSHSYNGNSMPAGWNDRVSSYLGASVVAPLCLVKLYEHENRLGSSTSPAHSRSTLGVMNDATSSYRISKAF